MENITFELNKDFYGQVLKYLENNKISIDELLKKALEKELKIKK